MTSWRHRAEAIREGVQSALSSLGRDTRTETTGGRTPPAADASAAADTARAATTDGSVPVVEPTAESEATASESAAAPGTTPFRMRGYRSDGMGERFGPQIDSSLAGLARSEPGPDRAQSAEAHPLTTEIFVGARSITRRELREMRARAEAAGGPIPEVRFGAAAQVPPAVPPAPVVPVVDDAGVIQEVPAPVGPERQDEGSATEAPPAVDREHPGSRELEPESPAGSERAGGSTVSVDAAGVVDLSSVSEDGPTRSGHEPDYLLQASDEHVPDEQPPGPGVQQGSGVHDDSDGRHAPPAAAGPEAIEMPVIVEIDATPIAMIGVEDHSEHDVVVAELIETEGRAAPAGGPASDEVMLAAAGDRAVAVPVGHWSLQATDEDENDLHEPAISRDVAVTGGGPMTHALVLPSVPDQEEQLQTPIVATGEIVITGLVDVTRADAAASALPDNGLALPEEPEVAYAEPEPVTAPSRAPLVVAIIGLGLVLVVAGAFFVAAVVYDIF